ncbi:MAG: hypothetical protein ACO4B3_09405 [Planctomycetota bacterium]
MIDGGSLDEGGVILKEPRELLRRVPPRHTGEDVRDVDPLAEVALAVDLVVALAEEGQDGIAAAEELQGRVVGLFRHRVLEADVVEGLEGVLALEVGDLPHEILDGPLVLGGGGAGDLLLELLDLLGVGERRARHGDEEEQREGDRALPDHSRSFPWL